MQALICTRAVSTVHVETLPPCPSLCHQIAITYAMLFSAIPSLELLMTEFSIKNNKYSLFSASVINNAVDYL